MIDPAVLQNLERASARYGITVQPDELLTEVEDGDWRDGRLLHSDVGDLGPVHVLYSEAMTQTSVSAHSDDRVHGPLLVLGPQISARSSDALRAEGVNFLDAAGNAFLRFPGVFIDVRGRRAVHRWEGGDGAKRSNLFSTRRAQVIFCLLSWPELIDTPTRTIAHHAKVSLGLAQETLGLLQFAGYLERRPGVASLRRVPELIDRWTTSYPTGLGSLDRARLFRRESPASVHLPEGISGYLSGEAGTDGVHGTTLHLYLDHWSPQVVRLNRWRSDREPNVVVRSTFWVRPSSFAEVLGLTAAPPLLVYADLLSADEGRQREAAEELRRQNPELRAS